jgi:predicted amino acid-binding ACT domain protein
MSTKPLILTLSCPDRRGIVAAVSAFLAERDCNILDAQQYDDAETGAFFMRVVFAPDGHGAADLRAQFEAIATTFAMRWSLRDPAVRKTVMILASQSDHCLSDLLYRWRIGELDMEIAGVISNHPAETYRRVDLTGLPFHHLPVSKDKVLFGLIFHDAGKTREYDVDAPGFPPTAFGRFGDLVGKALPHRLLATLAGGFAQPAHRERGAADREYFDRDLVVRATDAAALHFDHRLDVVQRDHEDFKRILAGLLLDLVEGAVDDALGDGLLAGFHEHVHELGQIDRPELRIREDVPLGYFATTWHVSSFVCFSG